MKFFNWIMSRFFNRPTASCQASDLQDQSKLDSDTLYNYHLECIRGIPHNEFEKREMERLSQKHTDDVIASVLKTLHFDPKPQLIPIIYSQFIWTIIGALVIYICYGSVMIDWENIFSIFLSSFAGGLLGILLSSYMYGYISKKKKK